jgi:Kef-type K+ transport system membrane component KefB
MSLLAQIAIFLAAAVIAIPIFRYFRLGSVLGYLAAGIIIGPACLGLISKIDATQHIAEFGIVLLMFVIGLELQPSRLWVMRKPIFGLGLAQVLATTVGVGSAAYFAFGQSEGAALIIGGRYVLRPMLRIVAATRVAEAFTAAGLLVVIGTALLVSQVGLSLSLGAFLAGVLLADSEFRHELEADIEPFKGLLLGLFFITVGMSANLSLVLEKPLLLAGLTLGFMLLKVAVLLSIGRLRLFETDAAQPEILNEG